MLQALWSKSTWALEPLAQMFLPSASVKLSRGQGLSAERLFKTTNPLPSLAAEGGGREAAKHNAFRAGLSRP